MELTEPDSERQLQDHATRQLGVAGYRQYEISNWSKLGQTCRHNMRYWQGENCLGLGPSAQSYMSGCRFGNVSNLDQYCRRLEVGDLAVFERESLSILQQDKERVVFGLRLLDGVPIDWVETNKCDPRWAATFTSSTAIPIGPMFLAPVAIDPRPTRHLTSPSPAPPWSGLAYEWTTSTKS